MKHVSLLIGLGFCCWSGASVAPAQRPDSIPEPPQVGAAVLVTEPPLAELAEAEAWPELMAALQAGGDPNLAQPDGTTALHWATLHNRTSAVIKLIDAGADFDAVNEYQVSPLSLACEYGCTAAGLELIRQGADVEAARQGRETPVMLAARSGDATLCQQLIQHGADVNATEQAGQTALMWAAAAGHVDAVEVLIQGGAELDHRLDKSDFSALLFAAREGRTACVMRLLDAGLDVNAIMKPRRRGARDPRPGTGALMLAIESGHLELALQLVDRGADPNDQRSGYAPLHAISWVRKTERGDNPAGDPPPRITGSIDSLEFVDAMVKAGADVNLLLTHGKPRGGRLSHQRASPFLLASHHADLPLMKRLLDHGADPTLTNAEQTTALMAAAGVGVVSVGEEPGTPAEVNAAIRMLVELGLNVNAVDQRQETAMHGAALRNFPSTVATLAELGADPKIWNRENSRGWTPHEIAGGQRPGSVKPSPPTIRALDAALEVEVAGR